MSNPYQNGQAVAPSSTSRPSKKLPAPFSRPRIDLGGSGKVGKRDWQWLNAFELSEDDIIAGEGVVQEVKTHVQYGAEWRIYLRTPRYPHGTIVEAIKKYYVFAEVKETKQN